MEEDTIDVLLGWPVSRGAVYASETLVWLVSGACLLACGFLGFQLSAATLAAERGLPALLILMALYARSGLRARKLLARSGEADLVRGSFDELGVAALDPRRLIFFSEEQYDWRGFPYVRFDPAQP